MQCVFYIPKGVSSGWYENTTYLNVPFNGWMDGNIILSDSLLMTLPNPIHTHAQSEQRWEQPSYGQIRCSTVKAAPSSPSLRRKKEGALDEGTQTHSPLFIYVPLVFPLSLWVSSVKIALATIIRKALLPAISPAGRTSYLEIFPKQKNQRCCPAFCFFFWVLGILNPNSSLSFLRKMSSFKLVDMDFSSSNSLNQTIFMGTRMLLSDTGPSL